MEAARAKAGSSGIHHKKHKRHKMSGLISSLDDPKVLYVFLCPLWPFPETIPLPILANASFQITARSPLQCRGLLESCEAAVGVGIRRDAPYKPSL